MKKPVPVYAEMGISRERMLVLKNILEECIERSHTFKELYENIKSLVTDPVELIVIFYYAGADTAQSVAPPTIGIIGGRNIQDILKQIITKRENPLPPMSQN